MKKSYIWKNVNPANLCLEFTGAKIVVNCNPLAFTESEIQKITQMIDMCSELMTVDCTYVDSKNSKYQKTFIAEHQWKALCAAINATKGMTCATDDELKVFKSVYEMIMLSYLYQLLDDFEVSTENIHLEVDDDVPFKTAIFDAGTADLYPGKWQLW